LAKKTEEAPIAKEKVEEATPSVKTPKVKKEEK